MSFRDRFALSSIDIAIIVTVLLVITVRVLLRSQYAAGGLLERPLRVGIVSWPGYAGGIVANNGLRANKDSDFWRNHQLLVEFVLVEDEESLWQQFTRGGATNGLDVIWSTVDALAHQYPGFSNGRIAPRAFLQVDWSRGGDAIISSAEINRVEDMRGKSVAVSMAASQWLLESTLENSSLSETEKTSIRLMRKRTKGSPEAREEFVSGNVDAAVLWEPDVTQALMKRVGSRVLVDTKSADHLIADVMIADQRFIEEHPAVIKAFIEGWLIDGTPKAIDDPTVAAKALQYEPAFSNIGEEGTRQLLAKTALATLVDNQEMFGLSGGDAFFDQLFTTATDLWLRNGYITSRGRAAEARNNRLLREVYIAHPTAKEVPQDCESNTSTVDVPLRFEHSKSDLTSVAERVLDDRLSFLLRTHSQVRLCIEASADPNSSVNAPDLSLARARSVVEYLSKHYDRPNSQFIIRQPKNGVSVDDGMASVRVKIMRESTPKS